MLQLVVVLVTAIRKTAEYSSSGYSDYSCKLSREAVLSPSTSLRMVQGGEPVEPLAEWFSTGL